MNLQATITAIEYHLPSEELTNEDLCASFPDWSIDKIEKSIPKIKCPIAAPTIPNGIADIIINGCIYDLKGIASNIKTTNNANI